MAAGLARSSPNVSRVDTKQPWWQQVLLGAALMAAGLVSSSPNVSRVGTEQPWFCSRLG